MGVFYHFSHFFEIITGIYFGGIALLGFLEKNAHNGLYSKLEEKKRKAEQAKVLSNEYRIIRIQKAGARYIVVIYQGVIGFLFKCLLDLANESFSLAHARVRKFAEDEKQKNLQKRFLPSFLYAGLFCLSVIFLSAKEQEHVKFIFDQHCSGTFLILYVFSSIVFFIWSFFIHRKLVNRLNYLHIIAMSVILCIILFSLSVAGAYSNWFSGAVTWFLHQNQKDWLVGLVVCTALAPLLFILLYAGAIFFLWEFAVLIYVAFFTLFKKRELLEELRQLTNNSL